jgi:hypothetical protein
MYLPHRLRKTDLSCFSVQLTGHWPIRQVRLWNAEESITLSNCCVPTLSNLYYAKMSGKLNMVSTRIYVLYSSQTDKNKIKTGQIRNLLLKFIFRINPLREDQIKNDCHPALILHS